VKPDCRATQPSPSSPAKARVIQYSETVVMESIGRTGSRMRGDDEWVVGPSGPFSLITPHDVDGPLGAVASGNDDGLRGTTLHIRAVGGGYHRREPVRPVPGNILSVGVTDIARDRLVDIGRRRFAVGGPIEGAAGCWPERPRMVSPEMAERRRAQNRMRRGYSRAGHAVRALGETVVCRKHQHCDAEGADQAPVDSIRHGTHPLLVKGPAAR
jgi:hypothetical protein